MEMWVRSQNKDILINATTFRITKDLCIYCNYTNGYEIEIGKYSTLEKAFEVLDMIEKYIYCDVPFSFKQIFQMPQDDEVEV